MHALTKAVLSAAVGFALVSGNLHCKSSSSGPGLDPGSSYADCAYPTGTTPSFYNKSDLIGSSMDGLVQIICQEQPIQYYIHVQIEYLEPGIGFERFSNFPGANAEDLFLQESGQPIVGHLYRYAVYHPCEVGIWRMRVVIQGVSSATKQYPHGLPYGPKTRYYPSAKGLDIRECKPGHNQGIVSH